MGMIETIQGEKQCPLCGQCKLLTMFSPDGNGGRQTYCKPCRSQRQCRRNKMMRKTTRHKAPDRIETWPRPGYELALDMELRAWQATPCFALSARL